MTIIRDLDQNCSVCGKSSPQPALFSTNTWGYPDIDFRPAPMQRDTMSTWILECPHCGYFAGKLNEELEIPKEFLKSKAYLTCDGNEFISKIAIRFYRRFMIEREIGNDAACFLNLQHCAWSCDDNEDPLAKDIRMLAMPYLERTIGQNTKEKEALMLIKADFLRRTSQFDRMIEEFGEVTFENEKHNQILRFQILKAGERYTDCYTGEDIFGE